MVRGMLAALSLCFAGAVCAAPLPRIVSINPCVDAVLVRVAQPEQILGISHYSQDPEATSIPLEIARRFRATSGTAEEVVALSPDIVMSGPHVSPSTIFALERMHIRVVKFAVPESVEQSERQIREIAREVGAPERGETLVRGIERAVDAARVRDGHRIDAVIWQGGGVVPGRGTLADQLLQITGYRNLSATYGLAKWDVLPLEYLLASPPQLVLSVGTGAAERDRTLGHPAVRRLAERVAFRSYPFRLLQCAGPTIVDAVARLAEVHRELAGANQELAGAHRELAAAHRELAGTHRELAAAHREVELARKPPMPPAAAVRTEIPVRAVAPGSRPREPQS